MSESKPLAAVEFEVHGNVALLTINRQEARNAVNGDVANAMEAAIDRLEADDALWVGIVAGAGPVFCAGADLKAVASGRGAEISTKRGGFGGIARRERNKPLIAAVDGAALAGGCEIALSCDLIVASTQASFGIPEVKRSLIAGAGGLFRLPRALPRNLALELAMTGDPITAERAYHFGMVNELCEPGQTVARAMVLAARISANAPLAVQASRRVVLGAAQASDDDAWRLRRRICSRRPDGGLQGGAASFHREAAPSVEGSLTRPWRGALCDDTRSALPHTAAGPSMTW